MKSILKLFALIFCLSLVSCEKDAPTSTPPLPPPPQMTGTWSGGTTFLFRINVLEQNSDITGTGMFYGALEVFINGKSNYPNVSFTLNSKGYFPASYSGTFIHPDTINGILNGSGFPGLSVMLVRWSQ